MSKTCITCKYAPPMKKWPCEDCDMRKPADIWEPKPQTNADRIRAMTDEELAAWLSQHLAVMTSYEEHPKRTIRWLDWLKQEVTTNSTT